MKRYLQVLGTVVLLILVLIAVIKELPPDKPAGQPPGPPTRQSVIACAKAHMRLLSAEPIEFPPSDDPSYGISAVADKPSQYVVTGSVVGKNLFGVRLRKSFRCTISIIDGQSRLVACTLD